MASIASRTVKPAGFVGSTRKASDPELAYLAGFIDGEGSIQIARGQWMKARNGYTLHLSAKQVHPDPLRLLASRFGGRVIPVATKQPNRRNYYRWGIVSRDAEHALRELRPHLRVKGGEADIGLSFRATFAGKGRTKVDEWLLAERDAYADALREAHHLEYAL